MRFARANLRETFSAFLYLCIPMKRHLSYFVSNFPILVFNLTYTLSCVLLFLGLLWVLPDMNFVLLLLISLGFLLINLFGWAYMHTLFTIPQKMAGAYDRIKNGIAAGEIVTLEDYKQTLTSFLVAFFDFSFMDVRYAAVNIGSRDTLYSSEKITGILNWEQVATSSATSAKVISHGRVRIEKEKLHVYTIPVWFVDDHLGYFTIFSPKRLGPIRLKILTDLEDHYVDDHVICLEHATASAKGSGTLTNTN